MTLPLRSVDDDARALARGMLAGVRHAVLGTLDPDSGAPHLSRIALQPGADGIPLALLSALAAHTRALRRDPRAGLLIDTAGGDTPAAAGASAPVAAGAGDLPAARCGAARPLARAGPEVGRLPGSAGFQLLAVAPGLGAAECRLWPGLPPDVRRPGGKQRKARGGLNPAGRLVCTQWLRVTEDCPCAPAARPPPWPERPSSGRPDPAQSLRAPPRTACRTRARPRRW